MLVKVRNDGGYEHREITLISHRGGKGFGPENTLQSLRNALDFGVEMIETDVRMSSDGIPVIRHSPFIGVRLLAHMSLAEIKQADPDIPTLQEYFELAAQRCVMNLEVKRCDARILAEAVDAAHTAFPVLVSSFDTGFLDEFRRTGVRAELGLLSHYELAEERMIVEAERCGVTTLLPISFAVRDGLVDKAHAKGLRVITWTVNSTALMRHILAAGVDGVITDCYPELKHFLASGELDAGAGEAWAKDEGGGCGEGVAEFA